MAVYCASKALGFEAVKRLGVEQEPSFDIVHIMPSWVLGQLEGTTVHLDDMAKMHVLALDSKVQDDQEFMAASPESTDWAGASDIARKRYLKECARGIFGFDSIPRPLTRKLRIDSRKAEKTFGFTFKPFEEQVVSVVDHFLELVAGKE
ncbi:hypothetical protein CDD83_10226 [Cordyceps sp. RAO-2017]|nr:hypothetical protein CDD83_10226 [Cordyceps sp. RAO-2017]